ncbi:PEP-CTERM sorting domain-containing protein [Iodobacter arcticus]|uniref:PEP-CTERM sorting domain-containing protein n=1 Tax=Iodobacter arcticus TaxID=590593 RepID=A0ABW2QWF2_9NEIS
MQKYIKRILVLVSTAALMTLTPVFAAVKVTAFSPSLYKKNTAEMDAIFGLAGYTIEDFEDKVLVPNLSYLLNSPSSATYTSLPNVFSSSSFERTINNHWDGRSILLGNTNNSYPYEGIRVNSVTFKLTTPISSFGVGLSNFQSLSTHPSQYPITDHEVYVNGVNLGKLENIALPAFVPGITGRNVYLRFDASGVDRIQSITFKNINPRTNNNDLLVFDHVAISPVPEPEQVSLLAMGLLTLGLRVRKKTSSSV